MNVSVDVITLVKIKTRDPDKSGSTISCEETFIFELLKKFQYCFIDLFIFIRRE